MIVAFCGIDGAGKTTLIRNLARHGAFKEAKLFRKQNKDNADRLLRFAHFGDTRNRSYYSGAHSVPYCWSYAFDFIAFYDSIQNDLGTGLCLMDRWRPCLEAWVALLPAEKQGDLLRVTSCIPQADLTFFLDVAPTIALQRLRNSRLSKADETLDLLTKLREAYTNLFRSNISRTIVLSDAAPDVLAEVTAYHIHSREQGEAT